MTYGNYQRRFLRAPLKEKMLFADGSYVLKAMTLNISEDGLLIDELPSFPEADTVPLMISLPMFPHLKNLSLNQLEMISSRQMMRSVFRATARIVRKGELSQNLDNIFKTKFGLQFSAISDDDKKIIQQYVATFSSNTVHLQTQIDSFNSDEDARKRTRALARVLGYKHDEKIASLSLKVTHDYQSMQWL